MTNPVSDPQQPEFEVYTPPAFVPPPQQPVAEAPVPPKPKKTGLIVLTVVVVLLFGAAGALGVLLVQEKDHTAGLSKQVEDKDRDIADLNRKVKESKDDATRAGDLQKQAEAGQKKAEAEAASSQKCRDAARALRAAALANDEPKGQAAGVEIFLHC